MREGSAGGASYGSNHPRGPGRDEDVEDGGILAASGIASSGGRRVVRHERAAVLGKWRKLVDVRAAAPRPRSFDVGVHRWAAVYNVFHAYPLPAALGAFGLLGGSPVTLAVALIWFAHIGADRLMGYGLKYPAGFEGTHLGRL